MPMRYIPYSKWRASLHHLLSHTQIKASSRKRSYSIFHYHYHYCADTASEQEVPIPMGPFLDPPAISRMGDLCFYLRKPRALSDILP
eukprot:3027931-Pleurochrysis_carterae.AAC.1